MADPVYDTQSGIAAPAALIERLAGDVDLAVGGVIRNSLALQLITAASGRGYITLSDGSRATSCDPLLGALYYRTRSNGQAIPQPTVVVTILNSLFQPLVLQPYSAALQTYVDKGSSVPQLYYPSYGSRTHVIPAARPHPSKPQTFLLGLGMFGFLGDSLNNHSGAMQLSYSPGNAGPWLGIAYWSIGTSPAAAAVSSDLSAYGDVANFYSQTVGAGPQVLPGVSSNSDVTISGIADPTPFTPNSTLVTVWVRPNLSTYTVQDGDTLTGIAKQIYGDGSLYDRIYWANRDKISNPDVIGSGWVLKIPELV